MNILSRNQWFSITSSDWIGYGYVKPLGTTTLRKLQHGAKKNYALPRLLFSIESVWLDVSMQGDSGTQGKILWSLTINNCRRPKALRCMPYSSLSSTSYSHNWLLCKSIKGGEYNVKIAKKILRGRVSSCRLSMREADDSISEHL